MKAFWISLSDDTQDLVMTIGATLAITAAMLGIVGGLVSAIAHDFHTVGVI